MVSKLITIAFTMCTAVAARAQEVKYVAGNIVGDTVTLREVSVDGQWKNDAERYRYNQMRYYVTTILPYLNAATALFNEINLKLGTGGLAGKERRRYINGKEKQMRAHFEPDIRALNTTQGVLLMKLISRQTGLNLFSMIREVKNPFEAMKWKVWGSVNGYNIDARYDPIQEPYLERIMNELGYPPHSGA